MSQSCGYLFHKAPSQQCFYNKSSPVKARVKYNEIICKHVHLIVGNHDYFAKRKWVYDLFETVTPYKRVHDGDHTLILCHYPILYWDGMDDDGTIHLYGHMHSREGMQHPHKDAYNVGVDVNNWYPVTLEELLERRKNETKE